MENNYLKTKSLIGYTNINETPEETYKELGFICGLEVHQQLKTDKKLFCHCPAGLYHKDDKYQGEVIRHMRPTLSEMGGYDGTALMEFKTKKNIVYHIANETTCTYDIDDTPPFIINKQALHIALKIAHLLRSNIVGELHITRKQYLDGSIPTGFQRTAIVSINGEIPLSNKKVKIIQLSIEEDACREISDFEHVRVYNTDRLGIPLIETVTGPELFTPQEAFEASQYIRFLNRSTGDVRKGSGATREDVNVSITGGTRVEIKGVSKIKLVPKLVHNEAFRQKSLLEIKRELNSRVSKTDWTINYVELKSKDMISQLKDLENFKDDYKLIAVNLPHFKGILSFFTQPGRMFADEISDRLKVIACIEKPNMIHSEYFPENTCEIKFKELSLLLNANDDDAQILFWGPSSDIATAIETIEERCLMAFDGVPRETRKALKCGTTIFERVLPGADRMYPDTDSAPISISDEEIKSAEKNLPVPLNIRLNQLEAWNVPKDTWFYLLRNNLLPLIENIHHSFNIKPTIIASFLGHNLRHLEGQNPESFRNASQEPTFDYWRIYDLFKFIWSQKLNMEIAYDLLPIVYKDRLITFEDALTKINYAPASLDDIKILISKLNREFNAINTSKYPERARVKWIMGKIHKSAVGNLPLSEVEELARKEALKNE